MNEPEGPAFLAENLIVIVWFFGAVAIVVWVRAQGWTWLRGYIRRKLRKRRRSGSRRSAQSSSSSASRGGPQGKPVRPGNDATGSVVNSPDRPRDPH